MANTRSELLAKAIHYCRIHGCQFIEDISFGFGVHGSVFACSSTSPMGYNALKIHERSTPYRREKDVYFRLKDLGIIEVEGHHVPEMIDFDDELLAIELTVVTRPFVLDFGGAYLDDPPDYGEEVLEQWERDKQEQFEENWPHAESILETLRSYGIYVVDVNPGNIGFVR